MLLGVLFADVGHLMNVETVSAGLIDSWKCCAVTSLQAKARQEPTVHWIHAWCS